MARQKSISNRDFIPAHLRFPLPSGIIVPEGGSANVQEKRTACIVVSTKDMRLIRETLISRRNTLLRKGRAADLIDEMLLKLTA